ncbi:DUF4148 domain-containing protein [Terrihabitans sp. B22-R8]|uniref:DUF4148 domain-containing protein n=1 Tax=Terrihabitans sp. B22-R8 TaxID=3425128 RepID=UPI00403CAA73
MRNGDWLKVRNVCAGLLVLGVLSSPVAAQGVFGSKPAASAQPQTREQIRIRLLDSCVLTQTKPGVDGGAAPQCRCYAAGITKAMTDEDIAGYRGRMPKRLEPTAESIWTTCQK